MGKGKVNLGPIGVEWETAMKDKNADLDFIKKQIDSYIIIIERSKDIDARDVLPQIRPFIAAMQQYGHLSRLDKAYQDRFFKITNWVQQQLPQRMSFSH